MEAQDRLNVMATPGANRLPRKLDQVGGRGLLGHLPASIPRATWGGLRGDSETSHWALAPDSCLGPLGLARMLSFGLQSANRPKARVHGCFRASSRLVPRALQAGGHRFDPGWLHCKKRLVPRRFSDFSPRVPCTRDDAGTTHSPPRCANSWGTAQ